MKITEETKILQIIEEYPETEEVIRNYFSFFFENRLEDIVLKRLSIKGAFNVLDIPEEKRKKFFEELEEKLRSREEI
jgi:hypothetical protein